MNSPFEKKRPTDSEVIANLSMKIVFLVLAMLVLVGVFVCYYFWKSSTVLPEEVFACGNAVESSRKWEDARVVFGNEIDFETAEKNFKQNCAVCHSTGTNTITGPGLQGASMRAPNHEWLLLYIRNADSLYKARDPYSVKLREQFPGENSHSFKELSRKEVQDIIAYLGV